MDQPPFIPDELHRAKLDAATPIRGDFVLYCTSDGCLWIGETNAAHAKSDVCPTCGRHGIRIWRK